MVFVAATFALLCLARVPAVLGHARVSSPPIRQPGNNFLQTCGQSSFNSVKGDPTGHIEEQEPVNAGCDLTLCRGMPFSDQPASNVQTVKPSQAMAMNIDCTVPHGGPANVSLIDTTVGGSGAFVGQFLATFDNFCPTTGPAPADQTNLQYTLPDAATIGNKCQQAGDCVVQLFWATPDFSQNYYYCVDVVMAAAAPPPPPPPPPPPATTAVVTPPTVAAPPPTVAPPPATVPAPVATPAGVNMGAPIAAPPGAPVKMVTSAAAANAPAATQATNGTVFNAANANAGRRRARILWF
ncbi:hypothetical protein C8F04DRAFT_998113 [Mycena alexandri]|uniref:Chitin-binding type-4 domain-containing protein n=1 Tax=Mycena alexandri TaxID=1745969 RepID=A0AAD6T5K0_9AGAR|nr:hypothetical protein C8F04DRAFT_998113 [Mycena alexandri]